MQIQPDIVIWETATGKERLRIGPNDGQVRQIGFSPDGRLLAFKCGRETIHVWDCRTGKEVCQFTVDPRCIKPFSFAPDGKTLASAGDDKSVLIWDVSALVPATKPAAEKIGQEPLTRCWDDLLGTDAARAYAAIAKLACHPDQAESLLKDKLADLPTIDEKRLARLIADLDKDDFKQRESASKELAKLGRLAEGALRKTLEGNPSAELKRRVQSLLEKLDPKEDDPMQRRLLRAIEVLERIGSPEARRLLQKLVKEASDPNTAREAQASLERLRKAGKGAP
jgi:hypothetical protein